MKNNLTELVFILDQSGSMAGLEKDTIGGFNAMIDRQKKQEGSCYVSTILFDHTSKVLHDRIKLEKVPAMTDKDYIVGGCTALIDTLGGAIQHIANIHKYARPEDIPAHTMFVITTDGQKNASCYYDATSIQKMIQHQKELYGWEFLFIGANIDAVETAAQYGIDREMTVNYHANAAGTQILYHTVAEAVSDVRASMPLSADWGDAISADYQCRNSQK